MRNNPTAEDRSWFEFVAAKSDAPAEILIYDYIGSFGVTAADFDRDLKALGPQANLNMRINSPGGETPTAASIYNMLERYKAKNSTTITVVIDGIAASAASWIAMLGDDIVMPENTLMMIHDPSGIVIGTSREMRSIASVLDKIKQGMVSAYMNKSGQSREDVEAIMTAETWFDAQEAVDAGFADRVDNPVEIAASFDLTRFKHPPAPGEVRAHIGAVEEVTNMTAKTETPAEMEARLRASITAELVAAAPKPEPVVAPVVAVAETQAQMETRIRGEFTAQHAEITALCTMAGKANMAAEFIAQNKTVADVRTALTAAAGSAAPVAAAAQNQNLNTRQNSAAPVADEKSLVAVGLDSTAIWANYNKNKGTAVRTAA